MIHQRLLATTTAAVLLATTTFVAIAPLPAARGSQEVTITIVNVVNPEARTVTVHCQSKDDDLGFHDLGFYGEYSWSFHPNALGGTLFWCRLYIAETDQCLVFDAYRQNQHRGNHVLRWQVEGADGVTGKTENGVPVRNLAYWHPC